MLCNSPLTITQHFIRTHMEQRNLEEALSCLTDTITWFGTGAFEIVHGKDEARQLLAEEITAFPCGYTIAFSEMTEKMLTKDSGTVFGRMLITDHAVGSQLDCRVTTTCVQGNEGFLIASLHMSLPTTLQNDREYYPLTIAEEKMQHLKDSFFNETIPGGLLCCQADQGFALRYVNDFFIKLLGYENKADFLSAIDGLFANCLAESENIAGMERDVQAMKIDERRTFTYRVKTKSGDEIWLREYTHKYEGDSAPELLCFCMDISDIIQMEQELKAQKAQLEFANAEIQTIISNTPGGVHRCPLFDNIHVDYVSPGLEEMSGYTRAEIHTLFQDNYTMLLVEEDRAAFSKTICLFAKAPAQQSLEYKMRRKDGRIIHVMDHFRSVRMEDGKMWGFGVATDVTSQHETLAQLKLLTDSIPGGLAVYEYASNSLKTIYFSDGVSEMIGYTRNEYAQIVATHLADMVFDEDLVILHQHIDGIVAGDTTINCVYRMRTKSGDYRWMNLRGTVAERRADVIRVNTVLLDITDSKAAEEKLRIRDEEYSLAIQQSGKTVYRYTIADHSVYMLQKAINAFGFPPFAQNVPQSIVAMDLIAPESVTHFLAFYEAILRGEKSGSATLRRKLNNGDFGWCLSHFTTLFNGIGEPVSAVISIEDVTKQHEQELENALLRQNEELLQIVMSHSDRFIVKYNTQTQTAYIQPRTAEVFGVNETLFNVPSTCVKKGAIAEESIPAYLGFYEKLIDGEPTAKAIINMRRNGRSDQWGWYQFDGSTIYDEQKQPIYAVISFIEVTVQYEKELAYERLNKHVNHLSKDAMLYFEANLTEMKIEHAGGHWLCHIKRNLEAESVALVTLLDASINEIVYPEDREAMRRFFERDNLLTDFSHGITEKEGEFRVLENNHPKWVEVTIEMIGDPQTEDIRVYILFRDIDESKLKEMTILKLAETDGLTELYNRTAIEWQIKQLLATKRDDCCALLIIDVDDLKTVNDTLGHLQGDRAIRAFADTLRNCFGTHALIGRIGGDEFLAFLPDIENEQALNGIMQALIGKLSALQVGEHDEFSLHGSIGIVLSNADDEQFETLYKKADTALYYVKRHGKNSYTFYSTDMDNLFEERDVLSPMDS